METILLIAIGSAGFLVGWLACSFFRQEKMQPFIELSSRTFGSQPCLEKLETIADTWNRLRDLIYGCRGGILGEKLIQISILMEQMDNTLGYEKED